MESRILEAGDVILLATGGHGFEVLEEIEMIEVKQGPYTGDQDKTHFYGKLPMQLNFGENGDRQDIQTQSRCAGEHPCDEQIVRYVGADRTFVGLLENSTARNSSSWTKKYFGVIASYYDLLYRDKDYEAEAVYVARTLRSVSSNVRKLLEFGLGTGRHGWHLAGLGFDVFGIERSEAMVAEAHRVTPSSAQSGGSFDCQKGDIKTLKLDRAFDAVISLFHVVSYQTSNQDLAATFNSAARHLEAGGVFLFDVWHGPAVLRERPSVRVKRIEDANIRLTRIAEPDLDVNAGLVTVNYTVLAESKINGRPTTFGEVHRMRYLFPSEVELLATQTGFRVEHSEQFLTGMPPSESSWGVTYVLQKRRQPSNDLYSRERTVAEWNEKKYLAECIDTGWISSEGPFVRRLEEGVADESVAGTG